MDYRPSRLEPVPRPSLNDASFVGNVEVHPRVYVVLNGLVFTFWRVGDSWTGGSAITSGRGQPLDEAWIVAARSVAVALLQKELLKHGGTDLPVINVRCPECQRLLSSSELANGDRIVGVDCGPSHIVAVADGRALVFHPDGSTRWSLIGEGL